MKSHESVSRNPPRFLPAAHLRPTRSRRGAWLPPRRAARPRSARSASRGSSLRSRMQKRKELPRQIPKPPAASTAVSAADRARRIRANTAAFAPETSGVNPKYWICGWCGGVFLERLRNWAGLPRWRVWASDLKPRQQISFVCRGRAESQTEPRGKSPCIGAGAVRGQRSGCDHGVRGVKNGGCAFCPRARTAVRALIDVWLLASLRIRAGIARGHEHGRGELAIPSRNGFV